MLIVICLESVYLAMKKKTILRKLSIVEKVVFVIKLRKLPVQTEVDLFLLGGQIIEDVVFINFDQKDCCAFFTDPTTEPGSTIIVDCQDIQAIRIESD